jgi:hypothetical protein
MSSKFLSAGNSVRYTVCLDREMRDECCDIRDGGVLRARCCEIGRGFATHAKALRGAPFPVRKSRDFCNTRVAKVRSHWPVHNHLGHRPGTFRSRGREIDRHGPTPAAKRLNLAKLGRAGKCICVHITPTNVLKRPEMSHVVPTGTSPNEHARRPRVPRTSARHSHRVGPWWPVRDRTAKHQPRRRDLQFQSGLYHTATESTIHLFTTFQLMYT